MTKNSGIRIAVRKVFAVASQPMSHPYAVIS